MWKPWKSAEKEVAKLLGGTRRVRIGYSESVEDVSHQQYAVEVKYGKQIPKWVEAIRGPTIVNGLLVLFPWPSSMSFDDAVEIKKEKGMKFILDGMCQAHGYSTMKRPLLALKRPRQRGFVFGMYVLDYMNSGFMLRDATRTEGISSCLWLKQDASPRSSPTLLQ